MATVTAVLLLGFVGSYGKNKCLIEYAKCCGDEAERVNLQTGITRVNTVLCLHCRGVCEQCLWLVCHIKPQPRLPGRSEGGFVCWLHFPERARKGQERMMVVWMGKKDPQLHSITWLRASLAGKSCVDGDTALRPLSQSHLERQWVFGRPTPTSGSGFDTSCVCSGKIYVVLDKSIWKSVMALEAPTGLNGPDKPYLGPLCPWPRALLQPLGLSVPALVMLQQCWSPALYVPVELVPRVPWLVRVMTVKAQGRIHCFV